MNANEKQQFLTHWARVRRRGIVLYVFATALSWGTLFAVFFRFVHVLLEQNVDTASLKAAYLSDEFGRFWVSCLLAGVVLGLSLWFFYHWQYRKLLLDR